MVARLLLRCLAFAAFVAVAPLARADDTVTTAHAVLEPPREPRWYGWQNLTVDTAAVVAGLATGGETGGVLFGTTYLLGGPLVHGIHGRPGAAFASLGLRVVVPAVGTVIGCELDDSKGMFGCLGGAALGFVAGYLTAVAVDAGALAWEDAPRAQPEGFTLAPTMNVGRGSLGLGISGAF